MKTTKKKNREIAGILSDHQVKAEFNRCEYCEEKPCRDACPASCSPADFIMAARLWTKEDIGRAAGLILSKNPLGGVCGAVCPERHCMAKCVHRKFDRPVNIPALQATIIQKAKEYGVMPHFEKVRANGKKVAIVGAGPGGLSAAATLARLGYRIHIYEKSRKAGGAINLIPEHRLDKRISATDIDFIKSLGDITIYENKEITEPSSLLKKYDAVIVATGLTVPIKPGIPGEELAMSGLDYLAAPEKVKFSGPVAVIGGGATACDVAVTARRHGAERVEMFALETPAEMPLTKKEMDELIESGTIVNSRTRVIEITEAAGKKDSKRKIGGIKIRRVSLEGEKFSLEKLTDIPGTEQILSDFKHVIIAIGARSQLKADAGPPVFYAGDMVNGPGTVVEAVAGGKNVAAMVDAFLTAKKKISFPEPARSEILLPGWNPIPVSLETDFFGRKILSPFLLSAAPPSDGYDQMKKAYEAGWAGGIMKTAFDNVRIHIPSEYMFAVTPSTYANCDNVSGHPLDRVCREVKRLVKEFPDRLTMASTGGPVTGNDESDRKVWQSNTKKLEDAGAMGIEYSLSCPQGGDGTEGDIVSQNPRLTAKIIDWVMEVSDPEIPKLFKLTAAVTSIAVILKAIEEVFKKYPGKKAGITLANTFPSMLFRAGRKKEWEEGIIVGLSGEGVIPISNLTLATAAPFHMHISGNGGPMDYRAAAHFLALGVRTVQFCTIVMKHGYGIINELNSGLSHLMQARGIYSMDKLIGAALPNPVRDFMSLPSKKKISSCDHNICLQCGNCTRCPYLAISFNEDRYPVTDPEKCIGCSICAQKCFCGAITMRERTPAELKALKES